MGRSRGGLTTKIHAVADVTGLPIRYDLSPGQAHDSTTAGAMLANLPPDSFLIADKAYDAKWIRDLIEQRDAVAIIPDREGAKTRHAFSKRCIDCETVSNAPSTSSSSSAASPPATKSSRPISWP